MNDDLTILASSYLDGELTDDERARVEGDHALAAEVERLRAVRAVLGDIEPAPISVRERHLAAALDSWDRIPATERSGDLRDATPIGADAAAVAGAASVTAPVSLAGRRRRRGNRTLLAAAAGLVAVLAGGLVARDALRGTSNDDVTSVADATEVTTADPTGRDALDVQAADETFGADAAEELVVAAPSGAPAEADSLIGSDEAPPDEDLEVLASDEDLATFAADLLRITPALDQTSDDVAAGGVENGDVAGGEPSFEEPFPRCDLVDRIVGPALWEVEGLFDELVVVGIADASEEAIAYSPETCNVVARTPLLER